MPAAVAAEPTARAARTLDNEILRNVNEVRARRGLPALHRSRSLARAASRHSRDQLRHNRASHTGSDGRSFGLRIRRYTRAAAVGETIGWVDRGSPGPAATIVRMWMRSPSHRRDVLDRSFRRLGVGARTGTLGGRRVILVTANFAS